jgi:uncharacterized membrane protein YjjP (DUF1212 family)
MTVETLIIIAIASWRIARMLVKEQAPFGLFEKLRAATASFGLFQCIWCVSVWSAFFCFALWDTPLQFVVITAAASGAGMLLAYYAGVER